MSYQTNIGNTMAYEWYKRRRAKYFKLRKFLHCAFTGSKKVRAEDYEKHVFGPYPAITKGEGQ